MKLIPLSKTGKHAGKHFAIVDDEDYEYLNQFNWSIIKASHSYYALRNLKRINKKQPKILMHRLILGLNSKNEHADHIDGNGLNNQKSNLRKCSHQQNMKNRLSAKGASSKYLGVSKLITRTEVKEYVYWKACINVDKKNINICHLSYTPDNEILAAKKYDDMAKFYHGEFANLNFK